MNQEMNRIIKEKELQEKIAKLEKENFDLKYNDVAKNSKITDLENIISMQLSGNQTDSTQKIATNPVGLGSGVNPKLLDYVNGKINL